MTKPLGILVDRESGTPLHRQLASSLRDAIRGGRLSPRERILSSRELQTHLGLSRNTVVQALEQLHAEGYLITMRGVGTFVADFAQAQPSIAFDKPETGIRTSHVVTAALEIQALAENLHASRPFRPGVPALDCFPSDGFRRCIKVDDWQGSALDYPDPQGHEPLREIIARRLRQTRGIECSPKQIFITSGAQAAFSLILRALLNRGEAIVLENPGYSSVRAMLTARGARIIPAPVDDCGIDVSAFSRRSARLAYVTPSHQYPTGAILSLERRFALLEWAQKYASWIVEDDYDSEFNYTGRPQPALYALAQGGRVLYVGTFSKVLSPALRVAYIVVPRDLTGALRALQVVDGGAPELFVQAALARFIRDGYFGRHVAKMRKLYDERRLFVSRELSRGGFAVRDTRAGLHFVAEAPEKVRDVEISAAAASEGLIVPALSSYCHARPVRNGLVIGYAASTLPQAKMAARTLSRIVQNLL